jgi:hypothetical protein
MPDDAKRQTLDQLIGENLKRLRGADSQDVVARKVRAAGLPWSRSTIAALEAGTKTLDVGELVVLSAGTGYDVAELIAGEDLVQLVPNFALSPRAIRHMLGSDEQMTTSDIDYQPSQVHVKRTVAEAIAGGLDESDDFEAVLADPALESKLALGSRRLEAYERILPRISNTQLRAAREAARGETEMKSARKLKLNDPVVLAVAAIARWGRSLTEERDARVETAATPDVAARTLQALRGHVTRQLVEELKPILREED